MDSTLGWKPESLMRGADFGKLDWSSTAITCRPAPMAKSISVAVGDSDTMRCGRAAVAPDVDRLADAVDPPAMPDSSVSNTATAAPTRATGVDARDARPGEEDI